MQKMQKVDARCPGNSSEVIPSTDVNQCHVPSRQAPPSPGKLEKQVGDLGGGGETLGGRTKKNAEKPKFSFFSPL